MKNILALRLAVEIMEAHNELCGYETFTDIRLRSKDESIEFNIQTSMLGTAFMIAELLNLTVHIEPNTDPGSDKQMNYYIT